MPLKAKLGTVNILCHSQFQGFYLEDFEVEEFNADIKNNYNDAYEYMMKIAEMHN